jgi:integrase
LQRSGSASIRIALRTGDYAVAVRRAAKIASWMLRMKTAATLEEALGELFPKIQELAVRPVKDEDDLVERGALDQQARQIMIRMYGAGIDPTKVLPGWQDCYLPFFHENVRAANILDRKNSVIGRLEWERHKMMLQGRPPVVTPELQTDPQARFLYTKVFPSLMVTRTDGSPQQAALAGVQRLRMSEVLHRLLAHREKEDGDRRAESEIGPIIKFAIKLWEDPVMMDVTGDQLLQLKAAIPDIPTPFGFTPGQRADLYGRWKHVQDNGWTFQRGDKTLRYKRSSETTITTGWRIALTALWEFAIEHRFAAGAVPDFRVTTKRNPPAVERDAFRFEELLKFFAAPAFGACAGRTRLWTIGKFLYQGFLYWGDLIGLLCGMRPGEIAQLRCRDILDLYGAPHFRFAQFSVEREELARLEPQRGGNDGKTAAAFRWIPIHWLLIRLGIVERRDAIVGDYIAKKVQAAGGRDKLSDEMIATIEQEAYEQWLFPDWPVYVKKTGEIKWSHHLSKAFTYGLVKLAMRRLGLTQYSARHTFKGYIDAIAGLSERSRKVLMGHSTKGDVTLGYGPKRITEEQSEVVQHLSNRQIWRLALILIRAKRRAEKSELTVIDAWRIDERSGDEKFQAVLAKRAELYL